MTTAVTYNLPDIVEDESNLDFMSARINETQRLIRAEGLPIPAKFYISQWLYDSAFQHLRKVSKSWKWTSYYWVHGGPEPNQEIPVEIDPSLSKEQIKVEWA
jgi:hypothetical protein